VVAYLTAARENLLSIFSDPGKFYGDDAYTFLFASALILIFGPGKFAIDAVLQGVLSKDAALHAGTAIIRPARPLKQKLS
jgi:hypothetical protein